MESEVSLHDELQRIDSLREREECASVSIEIKNISHRNGGLMKLWAKIDCVTD